MPRNQSERRDADEQQAFEYIEAWVEYGFFPDGSERHSNAERRSFGCHQRPGSNLWNNLSARAKRLAEDVPNHRRIDWVAWQRNPHAHPLTDDDRFTLIAYALEAEAQDFMSRHDDPVDLFAIRDELTSRAYFEILCVGRGQFKAQALHIFTTFGRNANAA